jgi:hypothetical protein
LSAPAPTWYDLATFQAVRALLARADGDGAREPPAASAAQHAPDPRSPQPLARKDGFFVSTPPGSTQSFVSTLSTWLASLPHDLRVLFEAKDEPNLDRVAREAACGAIISVITPDTGLGGTDNQLSRYADDAVLVRVVLKHVADRGGEGAADFRERFADYYDTIDADLAICREAMGEIYEWIEGKVPTLDKAVYKGKKLAEYLDDDEAAELLYEDGLAYATDYPLDDEKLEMRFKKAETVLEPLRRKAENDRKKI